MDSLAPASPVRPSVAIWRSVALSVIVHGLLLLPGNDFWLKPLPPNSKAIPTRINLSLLERSNAAQPPLPSNSDNALPSDFAVQHHARGTGQVSNLKDSGPGFSEPPDFSGAESIHLSGPFRLRIRIRVSERGIPEIEIAEKPAVPPEYLLAILEGLTSAHYSPALKDGKPAAGYFELIIQAAPLAESSEPSVIRSSIPTAKEN